MRLSPVSAVLFLKRPVTNAVGLVLRSFRTKLIMLVMLSVLAPSFVIGLVTIQNTKRFQTNQTEEKFRLVLKNAKRDVEYWNSKRKSELEKLVWSNVLLRSLDLYYGSNKSFRNEEDRNQIDQFFEIVKDKFPMYERFVVLDNLGKTVIASPEARGDTDLLGSFLVHVAGEFFRSSAYLDKDTGAYFQWLLLPVSAPAGNEATVCVKARLDDLTDLLGQKRFPDVDDLYIVDATGRLLTLPRIGRKRLADQKTTGSVPREIKELLTANTTASDSNEAQPIQAITRPDRNGFRGSHFLLSAVPERSTQWWIVCEAAESRVIGPVVKWRNQILYVTGIIYFLLLAVAWRLSHNLLEPLSQLSLGAKRINQGLVGVKIPVARNDEVGEMTSAFNEMAERIALNEAKLKKNYAELARANDDLQTANRKLGQLSITDGLTGLFNHRHFWKLLNGESRRTHSYPGELALVLLDIDNFKQVNDQFGHTTGDRLIQRISAVLQASVRSQDIVARYGGEEFAVLLPDTDREGALTVSEKIRAAVEREVFKVPETDIMISITVSVGVSVFVRNRNEFFNAADRALYKSKTAGKNQVSFALAES